MGSDKFSRTIPHSQWKFAFHAICDISFNSIHHSHIITLATRHDTIEVFQLLNRSSIESWRTCPNSWIFEREWNCNSGSHPNQNSSAKSENVSQLHRQGSAHCISHVHSPTVHTAPNICVTFNPKEHTPTLYRWYLSNRRQQLWTQLHTTPHESCTLRHNTWANWSQGPVQLHKDQVLIFQCICAPNHASVLVPDKFGKSHWSFEH